MKYLYKYPQQEFPYLDLVCTNRKRSREEFEYELLDTGVFDQDRYFDVFVEYAKGDPEDILIRISVFNRGSETADLHLLPTLWFRNTWSRSGGEKPELHRVAPGAIVASSPSLGECTMRCEGNPELLFTENESNAARLWGKENSSPYVKDAFHEYLIARNTAAVNSENRGTKAAALYRLSIPPGEGKTVRLRLSPHAAGDFLTDFDQIFNQRVADADEFYNRITPTSLTEDERRVHRQALAGMPQR